MGACILYVRCVSSFALTNSHKTLAAHACTRTPVRITCHSAPLCMPLSAEPQCARVPRQLHVSLPWPACYGSLSLTRPPLLSTAWLGFFTNTNTKNHVKQMREIGGRWHLGEGTWARAPLSTHRYVHRRALAPQRARHPPRSKVAQAFKRGLLSRGQCLDLHGRGDVGLGDWGRRGAQQGQRGMDRCRPAGFARARTHAGTHTVWAVLSIVHIRRHSSKASLLTVLKWRHRFYVFTVWRRNDLI